MDIDVLYETERCLLQFGDAEAGDSEQHDLRLQLGRFKSRVVEDIDGRDVSRKSRRKVEDRSPAIVGRDGQPPSLTSSIPKQPALTTIERSAPPTRRTSSAKLGMIVPS